MGDKRRLKTVWWVVFALAASASGCSNDDDAEERRRLLAASERSMARKQRVDENRVRAQTGELLPSKLVRAGIVVPRGFEPKFEQEHSWTYDARLSRDLVVAYFDKRIAAEEIRRAAGQVEYLGAHEKSDPNGKQPVVVTVSATPGREGESWTRVVIKERPPAPVHVAIETDEMVRQRVAERRKSGR